MSLPRPIRDRIMDAMVARLETLKVVPAPGAFLDAFVSAGSGGLINPQGLTFGPDGNLYVSSNTTAQVLRYNGTTGAFLEAFVSFGSGGLINPQGLTFGPDGNLYVSSYSTHQVLRYNGTTGAFLDAFVSAGSGGLSGSTGLVFGPDGNLYVSDYDSHQVLRYNGTTGAFLDAFVSAGSGGLVNPQLPAFGPDGNFYVGSEGTAQVLRYNGTTGAFLDAFVSAGSGGLMEPEFLIFRPDGKLYVSSYDTSEVLRYAGPKDWARPSLVTRALLSIDQYKKELAQGPVLGVMRSSGSRLTQRAHPDEQGNVPFTHELHVAVWGYVRGDAATGASTRLERLWDDHTRCLLNEATLAGLVRDLQPDGTTDTDDGALEPLGFFVQDWLVTADQDFAL